MTMVGEKMSNVAKTGWIVLAAVVLICGVALGLRAGYTQFGAVSFGLLPALAVLFPVVREQRDGKLTFVAWLGTLLLIAFFAVAFHNLIRYFT